MTPSALTSATPAAARTYTLMQFIVAMTVLAVVAIWAIPVHQRYIKRQASLAAAHDLSALQKQIQNHLAAQQPVDENTLPPATAPISISTPAGTVTTTVSLMQQPYASQWHPAAGDAFEFGAAFNTDGYTLSAMGRAGYACKLSLVMTNATSEAPQHTLRAAEGPDCGFGTW